MYKIIDEFKVGVNDFFVLTLNEQMRGCLTHCRIDDKEYKIYRVHYSSGRSSAEKMLDAMLRNFAIKEPDGGSFVGKEVEFF